MDPDEEEEKVCRNCTEETGSVHLLCVDCNLAKFCLPCFSCGVEVGSHRKNHRYRVISEGVNIFGAAPDPDQPSTSSVDVVVRSTAAVPSWTALEEKVLLDYVEKYNMGNWQDIAQAVGEGRCAFEVKEHYDKYYVRGRLGEVSGAGLKRPTIKDQSGPIAHPLNSPPIRPSVCKLHTDDLRLLAYMPHRDDFEKEWNNEAETRISGLMLSPEDDELDKSVKLAQIDRYIREVAERRRMKALARDYDLVPTFFKQERPASGLKAFTYAPADMKKVKEEREVRESLKRFSQFIPSQDMEDLVSGLTKARTLKERIEELQQYRKNGVTTLAEGGRFEDWERLRGARPPHGNENSNWKPPSKGNDTKNDSASTPDPEKLSATGNGSGDGKKSWPSPPEDKSLLLSRAERQLCAGNKMNTSDYVLVKTAVLREELQKREGVALRRNLRQDTMDSKQLVHQFCQSSGWLPLFAPSISH